LLPNTCTFSGPECPKPSVREKAPPSKETGRRKNEKGEREGGGTGELARMAQGPSPAPGADLMTRSADNWRKDSTWGVVASKAGLAHTRAVVDDQCSNLVVSHTTQLTHTTHTGSVCGFVTLLDCY